MDMDIEDDDNPNSSHRSKRHRHTSKDSAHRHDDGRSENVRLADAAMKSALKPYFAKRLINKEEYKEIMKRGVSKLSATAGSLKPEKVEKFVKQYVDIAKSKRRSH